MAITAYDNRRTYTGNGSTTTFPFPVPFTENTDLVVQLQALDGSLETKIIGTNYTVGGAGNPAGGIVNMIAAPAVGQALIIYRDVPLTQPLTLLDGGPLPASTVSGMFDRMTMWGQRLREMADTAFAVATQTMNGLMSATDKVKLDGIQIGAQVNTVTSVSGYTGAVFLAKADVGLSNVDNTSDFNKPISTATQTALNAKLTAASNLSDLINTPTARTNLGVAIGSNVQAYSARLADIAAVSWARGDVIYYNGSALVQLAAGTAGQVLMTGGPSANPSWATISGTGTVTSVNMTVPAFLSITGGPVTSSGTFAVTLSGTALPVVNGGTGLTTCTAGDILYGTASNTLSRLGVGSNGQILTVVSGAPAWATIVNAWAPGTLKGLTLSRPTTTTIGISAGSCVNEDGGTAYNMTAVSAITKGLGTWTAGTGNGGLDSGLIAASTWYHIHLIRKDSDGAIDALLSLSPTAPTMPGGYSARRRLGAIKTDGSSQIISFIQTGDEFRWSTPVVDADSQNPGTVAVNRTLSTPSGIVTTAIVMIGAYAGTSNLVAVYASPLAAADVAPQAPGTAALTGPESAVCFVTGGIAHWSFVEQRIATDTNSQIRTRSSTSGASDRLGVVTNGWIDTRGRI